MGFLADTRRLNVAVTRAKRHVAVVCDAECCGSDAFIGRLVRHIEDKGDYRSALELDMDPEVMSAAPNDKPATAATSAGSGSIQNIYVVSDKGPPLAGEGNRGTKTFVQQGASSTRPRRGGGCMKESSKAPSQIIADEDILAQVRAFAETNAAGATSGSGWQGGELDRVDKTEFELSTELTARQRAIVHETAQALGIGHVSRGEGSRRTLVLSRAEGGQVEQQCTAGGVVVQEPSSSVCSKVESAAIDSEGRRSSSGSEADVSSMSFAVLTATPGTEDDHSEEGVVGPLTTDLPGGPSAPTVEDMKLPSGGMSASDNSNFSAGLRESRPECTATVEFESEAATQIRWSATASTFDTGDGHLRSTNSLLASLHAEREARQSPPPPPPAQASGRKKGKGASAGRGPRSATVASADDRGFAVELGVAGVGAGSGVRRSSSKKGGSGGKKGKKGRGDVGVSAGTKSSASRGTASSNAARADIVGGGGGDEEIDDDLAFLDAQIKTKRAAEPCYASLLRSTTEVMRERNPAWGKANDKIKPSKSTITAARRGQLQGALHTRLAEDGKKRSKATTKTDESK